MTKLVVAFILLALTAVPAMGQTLYDNGYPNGNLTAYTVNFGYAVSDSFNVSSYYGYSFVTGASFAMWLFEGDTLKSAELSITSLPFGGTAYFDQTVTFTQGPCTTNQYGYSVCTETTNLNSYQPMLNNGAYWLTLQNASVSSGGPVYWDENFGPSKAKDSSVLPMAVMGSEAFTVLGYSSTCICGCSAQANCADAPSSTAPEPGSLWLFGPGCLALFGLFRGLQSTLF
jgi:hypothetical protein